MRPVRSAPIVIATLALAAIVIAGCTAEEAGWTYAPPPSATPAPSVEPSAEPASPAPTDGASAAPTNGPSGEAVQITAVGIAFEQSTLTVPAGAPFQIEFDNQDGAIPHDVDILDDAGTKVFDGEVITGPAQIVYEVPALEAGAYTFICSVHPTMTIDVTAE